MCGKIYTYIYVWAYERLDQLNICTSMGRISILSVPLSINAGRFCTERLWKVRILQEFMTQK